MIRTTPASGSPTTESQPSESRPSESRPSESQPGKAPTAGAPLIRRVPYAALILAVLGGGLCALLALNTAVAASEVRERNLDATNAALTDREQQLSREVAALQAPNALARRAAALGLVPADAPAFLRIGANGRVTVLGSPAAVTAQAPPPLPASGTTSTTAATPSASGLPRAGTTRPPASTASATGATTAAAPSSGPAGTSKPSATASPTGTPSPAGTGRSAPTSARPSPPSPAATPTPRTPTVTLPGGPR